MDVKSYTLNFVLGLLCAGFAAAQPLAYWRFEAGPANDAVSKPFGAVDSSGNGNHLDPGTEAGSDGFWYRGSVAYATIPGTGAANRFCIQNSGSSPSLSTRSTNQSYGAGSYPAGIDIETITPAQFTVEAFFKPESTGTYRTIVGRDAINVSNDSSKLAALYLQIKNNDNDGDDKDDDERVKIQFTDVAGYDHVAESAPYITKGFNFSTDPQGLTGKWYYIAAVSDGSTLSLYLANVSDNGPLWLLAQTDMTISGSPNTALAKGTQDGTNWHTGAWSIGRGLYDGKHTDRAWGFIDEVRISNTALTPDQFLYPWEMESTTVKYNPVMYGADPDVLLVDNQVSLYPASEGRQYFYAYSSP
jgi:hypothetical protein